MAPKPTVLALTATATPTVCDDIRQMLAIDEQATVMTGFSRENLALSVLIGENKERYVKIMYNKINRKWASFMQLLEKLWMPFMMC